MVSRGTLSSKNQLIWLRQAFVQRMTLRSLIIIAPLAVAISFSMGFMEYQSARLQQRTVDASHANQIDHTKTLLPELPLVTQPVIPQLQTGPAEGSSMPTNDDSIQTNSRPGTTPSAVGPSSRDAGHALQPVNNDASNDKDGQLQATRKAVKLEQLDL